MKKMLNNRFFHAINILILVSASIHILLLLIYAFKTGEFIWLNYFNILEIDLLYPGIVEGPASMLLATTVMVVIFLIAYLFIVPKK